MKSLSKWLMVAMLVLGGCANEGTTDTAVGAGEKVRISVGLPESRLQLGEKEGESYPVYWSKVDYIYANNIRSSRTIIDKQNPTRAEFEFDKAIGYPIYINYEFYHEDMPSGCLLGEASHGHYLSCFATEQYEWSADNTFIKPNMCGRIEREGDGVTLQHLAGVLRFAIKGDKEGRTLKKIVISSMESANLAGIYIINDFARDEYSELSLKGLTTSFEEFATLLGESNGDVFNQHSITLNCDTSKPLSTSANRSFNISLPEGDHGLCYIDFVATDNSSMRCVWDAKGVKAGVVREFKGITFNNEDREFMLIESMEAEESPLEVLSIFGYVKDCDGNPIEGVAVSDGFSVVATDAKGYYTMKPSSDSYYIFITVPAEYEIPIDEEGHPAFYRKYPFEQQYDFTLTPLVGGKEERFALFALADPQVWEEKGYTRFCNETVPGIARHRAEIGIPCYGITLGDIISTNPSKSGNASAYREPMRRQFDCSKIGMPIFQVMGNHDNTYAYYGGGIIPTTDRYNSTWQIKMQRDHEAVFGPANFSFDRGDAHIIGMRNVEYYLSSSSEYTSRIGFMREQLEWLKADLALVPKDKMVVLCAHIPFVERSGTNTQAVMELLASFKEAHILTGHTHYNRNYEHEIVTSGGKKLYEHIVSALCGAWWDSNISMDGSPVGYQVFTCEGNHFSDWYYMGYTAGMNSRKHQMRLYRGNAVTGGKRSGTDSYGTKGYYKFNYGEDVLLANIYNADGEWRVEVYEDGLYSGDMEPLPNKTRPYHDNQPSTATENVGGDGSLSAPYYSMLDNTSSDMYFAGLYLGILGKKDGNYNTVGHCFHMYKYTLKNRNAKIVVKATDRFGNIYTEEHITEGTDYSLTAIQ